MNNPLTIGIINYNYGKFLDRCIKSVLKQKKTAEVIFVDDGSTDNSLDIANQYGKKMRIIALGKNCGTEVAKSRAVSEAKTPWVCTIDADDAIDPEYASKIFSRTYPKKVAIVYTDILRKGQWQGVWEQPDFDPQLIKEGRNYIHGGSVFRKKAYIKVGGYKITPQGIYEDWWLWKDMVLAGYEAVRIPEPLYYYYKHSENQRNEQETI